jgi:hypothetical protein
MKRKLLVSEAVRVLGSSGGDFVDARYFYDAAISVPLCQAWRRFTNGGARLNL